MDFIKAYLSSEAPCSQEGEYRYLLRLKINLARYHGELSYPNTLALYQEINLDFTQLLGATDDHTFKVRFDHAQYLSAEGKLATAVDVCLDALGDLSGALQISDQKWHRGPRNMSGENISRGLNEKTGGICATSAATRAR